MICYLVRHGKDDDTVRGGWSDHGLTPLGIEQAHTLAKEISATNAGIDRIYSSDLQRAKETAEILSSHLSLPVRLLFEFREVDNGDLAGMKNDLADKKYPGLYWSSLDYSERYPNGESPEMFYRRVEASWSNFKVEVQKNSSNNVLLVTHGGVIEAILCIENGLVFSNKKKHFVTPNAQLIPIEIK